MRCYGLRPCCTGETTLGFRVRPDLEIVQALLDLLHVIRDVLHGFVHSWLGSMLVTREHLFEMLDVGCEAAGVLVCPCNLPGQARLSNSGRGTKPAFVFVIARSVTCKDSWRH